MPRTIFEKLEKRSCNVLQKSGIVLFGEFKQGQFPKKDGGLGIRLLHGFSVSLECKWLCCLREETNNLGMGVIKSIHGKSNLG